MNKSKGSEWFHIDSKWIWVTPLIISRSILNHSKPTNGLLDENFVLEAHCYWSAWDSWNEALLWSSGIELSNCGGL